MSGLTAVIVTYNRARYVADAIESVLAQDVDLELLVVDDGSTDDTAEVVSRYGEDVRYVRQDNRGRAGARNTAVRLARGDLIAFCDSDDRWLPGRLERELEAIEDRPDVGMVHGQVELTDCDLRPLAAETHANRTIFSEAHRGGATYAGYASNCRCLSSTILVRREVFDSVGMYDASLPIEDYDFYLRLLLHWDVLFLDGPPLAQYRTHSEGNAAPNLAAGQIRTAEKHLALLEERPDIPDARRARRNFNLMIARTWRVQGDRRRARAAALRALRLGAPQALRVAL
ncbi:MAG: glycosyltransferase [Actinobacteria bacterium]|nr:glycosyltransferase [Actinomycetota bacterium]